MTEPITTPVEQEPDEQNEPTISSSLFDDLRRQRQELADDISHVVAVEGYEEPGLLVEYRLLGGNELSQIERKVMRQTKDRWQRQLNAAMDVMIAAATGIYYTIAGQEPEPLRLVDGGDPVTGFNSDLAEILGMNEGDRKPTAREIVAMLLGNKDLAIAKHSAQLQAWMAGSNADIDAEFLGEAP